MFPRIDSKVEIDGTVYSAELGRATKTSIGFEDHGMFMALIEVEFGGSAQAIAPIQDEKSIYYWITNMLRVFGASDWEHISGKLIWVLRENDYGFIRGVMNPFDQSKYCIFEELFLELKESHEPTHV